MRPPVETYGRQTVCVLLQDPGTSLDSRQLWGLINCITVFSSTH